MLIVEMNERKQLHSNAYTHTHILTYIFMYIYVHTDMYVANMYALMPSESSK